MAINKTAATIRNMFSDISHKYDLMNTLITFGRDRAWRRYMVDQVLSTSSQRMLDVGTGTGRVALEAKKKKSDLSIVGADFTLKMMLTGRKTSTSSGILWCGADAFQLPFHDASFDLVTSGYLIRNVTDVAAVFHEQFRVLSPGGRIACLDTTPPENHILKPLILAYFKWIIPFFGALIAGDRQAYEYLSASIRKFKNPEKILRIMEDAGFKELSFKYFMFRTMSVYVGIKPVY